MSNPNKLALLIITTLLVLTPITLAETQNVTVEILPEISGFTINSPTDTFYSARRIPFNITSPVQADRIQFMNHNDNNPRFRRLCSNCFSYGFEKPRLRTVREGNNKVTVRLIDELGAMQDKNISFFVDSRKPRISKTTPSRGFANGTFTVEFTEQNPVDLTLFYGNSFKNKTLNISDECAPDGNKQVCETKVNLSEFDNSQFKFWFNLTDIAGSVASSRIKTLDVDFTSPTINEFNFTIDRRRVSFFFNITEFNFDRINFIDFNDTNPRFRRLCSRLTDEQICEKTRSFSRGKHNLTLEILDDAENKASIKEVNFFI
jgi:hypothetical protein